MEHDRTLDNLLLLDGERFIVDDGYWVKFEVKRVSPTAERPHGLDYSLTLHDSEGDRVLGFDNAHPIREGSGPGARTRIKYDHKHKGERLRFYDYQDAVTLLTDFWEEVDAILKKGAKEHEGTEDRSSVQREVQGADDGYCEGRVRSCER